MNGKWISPFRIIPYLTFWLFLAFILITFFAVLYQGVAHVPNIFITGVAIIVGLSIPAFFAIYNRCIDRRFNVSETK